MSATDKLTIIRGSSDRIILAKRIARDQVTGKVTILARPDARFFSVKQVEVDGIDAMAAVLTGLEADTRAAVIRDEPKGGINWHRTQRRSKGKDATFDPVPRRWIAIEFDSVVPPGHVDPLNWDEAVEFCLSLLPPELERGRCWAAFTSSAGFKPGIRMQLWFWLDRSLAKPEIIAWLADTGADLGQYDNVKMRFVARPVFGPGVTDPIQRRSGIWRGEDDMVEVPPIDVKTKRNAATIANGDGTGLRSAHGYDGWKARITPGDRHRNTLSAICAYVAVHSAGGTDPASLKRDLLAATFAAYDAPDQGTVDSWSLDIDAQITWALEREGEKNLTAVRADLTPHFPAPDMTIEAAQAEMTRAIRSVFESGKRCGVRAPAGSGKSQLVLNEIKTRWWRRRELVQEARLAGKDYGLPARPTLYFVPTIALGRDLADRLSREETGLRVQLIRGRTAGLREGKEADGPPPCLKAELAAQLSANGIAVKPTLCERFIEQDGEKKLDVCEHRYTCDYFKQFKSDADVYVMAHQYLFTGRTNADGVLADLPEPGAVVIDESFLDAGISGTWLSFEDWSAKRPEKKDEDPSIATARGKRMTHAVALIRDTLTARTATLTTLQDAGFTAAELRNFSDEEAASNVLPDISPGMAVEAQSGVISKLPPPGSEQGRAALWRLLAEEMDAGFDTPRRVRFEARRGMGGISMTWRRKPKLKGTDAVPLLLIDADLEPELVEPFFLGLEHVTVSAERAACVFQVVDKTGSKTQLLRGADGPGRVFDDVVGVIEAEAYQRTVLVVGTKAVIDKMKLHPWLQTIPRERLEFVHFGALRGIDRWKDRDSVVVVGREQPPSQAIEDMAAALFWDQIAIYGGRGGEEPIERVTGQLPLVERGIRIRSGGAVPVDVPVHPDRRVQLVMEQVRERQSAQAIDRLRLIYVEKPKRAIILGKLVLDLTVDEVVTIDQIAPSKGERVAMRHGVLPLAKTDLHRIAPDLFQTVDSAKRWITDHGGANRVFPYIELNIGKDPISPTAVEYRRAGATRSARALVFATGPAAIRKKLTAALGELTTLDIDVGDGPPDTPIVALQPPGYDPELWEPQEWAGRPIHWGDPLLLTVGADPIDGYDADPNRIWLVINDAPQGGYLKDVEPLNALVLAAAFNRDAAKGVFHELAAVEHTLTELNRRFPKDWYPWEAVDEANTTFH